MEDESLFCVGFYCVFRSTQPTVVIESVYRTHVNEVFQNKPISFRVLEDGFYQIIEEIC